METLSNILLMACGAALLVAFVLIKVTGGYLAVEPNKKILLAEIGLVGVIVIFAIIRFIMCLMK